MEPFEEPSLSNSNNDINTIENDKLDGCAPLFRKRGIPVKTFIDRKKKVYEIGWLKHHGQESTDGKIQYAYGTIEARINGDVTNSNHSKTIGDYTAFDKYGKIYTSLSIRNSSGKVGRLVSYFKVEDWQGRKCDWVKDTLLNLQKTSVFYPDSTIEKYSDLKSDDPSFKSTGFDQDNIKEQVRESLGFIWDTIGRPWDSCVVGDLPPEFLN
ncbi:uncharacterized protein I206_106759 [Kwoniella pini CBS 10737]|uniref:Uncharacterized protein n=1 Tax=Kwoniella pini CBS 10737 TaxID=1296096 RepID=A0A1B9HTB0_9TREE|nr:uncharacterized protein I206_07353 [Kwoniella pini CBS 10737]OCF46500.1 hypothetical protein I206_07353 [Kwoniella pini CBS 10737]